MELIMAELELIDQDATIEVCSRSLLLRTICVKLQNLAKGVDILVAKPGRLVDMIERGKVSLLMVRYLALDEADRMLEMGFEPRIYKIVQHMDMPRPGSR